jgi:dTDP-4-amino-4,6-dideoxygalactose transaminase
MLRDYSKLIPSNLQADIGLEQLVNLDNLNNKRIENALYLLENLKGLEGISLPPLSKDGIKNIFTNFPIKTQERNLFARELLKKGIDTACGYIKTHDTSCTNAEAVEQSIVHIPIYPSLNEPQLLYISQAIKEIVKR